MVQHRAHPGARRGARHLVRASLPRHRRHPALRRTLPFCLARGAELRGMAQGSRYAMDAAPAAAFPRHGALRLPPLQPRPLGMDIGFTEEQELLRTSARRFLENECPSAFVRQRMAEPAAMTENFWQKLAEQGWFGILYPDELGGSGLGLVDMTVLMEEMGRAVMPGPFFSTVLLGGSAILEAGSPGQRQEWLPRIAEGSAKVSLAWTEPNARWDAAATATRWKMGSACSWCRRRPRASGSRCCRRSTRPANCARSGSTTLRC